MKNKLMTVLTFSIAVTCAHAAEQPVIADNDMAYMKQQQRELEQFKQQLQGANIALPDMQQGRVNQLRNEIAASQAEENSADRPTPRAVYFVSLTSESSKQISENLQNSLNHCFTFFRKIRNDLCHPPDCG